MAGVCGILCVEEDPPWENCPTVPVTLGKCIPLTDLQCSREMGKAGAIASHFQGVECTHNPFPL